jgi:hypothetical protein
MEQENLLWISFSSSFLPLCIILVGSDCQVRFEVLDGLQQVSILVMRDKYAVMYLLGVRFATLEVVDLFVKFMLI